MVPQVVQMHVFRRGVLEASRVALREARSFASQLATALARATGDADEASGGSRADAPATLRPWLTTPARRALADDIALASRDVGVPPRLALAVAVAESSLDPTARASDGKSTGTFQVTAPTAADIRRRLASGALERPSGGDDVALGVAHLRWLDDLFGRTTELGGGLATTPVADRDERRRFAVAAYNAGEGRVARAQERARALHRDPTRYENVRPFLPAITRRYVDRVMRYSGEGSAIEAA